MTQVPFTSPNTILAKVVIYGLGTILIAFGIVILLRSDLGMSSWDSLNYSISQASILTLGQANIAVAGSFTIFVTIMNKNIKYLLIWIPIIIVGILIDLFNTQIILNQFNPESYERVIGFIVGLFLIPYGASILITSTFPAGVYEELMITIMRLTKSSKLIRIRFIMEFLAVLSAVIIGFLSGFNFGMVTLGTVIISLFMGPILRFGLHVNSQLIKIINKTH